MKNIVSIAPLLLISTALNTLTAQSDMQTFQDDVDFLQEHKSTIVLKSDDGSAQIAIIPDYQGRVMTSTAQGSEGRSFGWINYDLIASGKILDHMNAFGGEDRFWLGPEGGQYSIFFNGGSDFTPDNWQTPPPIDSEPFVLLEQGPDYASFRKETRLTNYQNYTFDIQIDRTVVLLDNEEIENDLEIQLDPQIAVVGYRSNNVLTNTGSTIWNPESGLLSIWILGMYIPSPITSVIIPYKGDLNLNTAYFGEVGSDRLKINPGYILFKGDGKYRSKIGVPPTNATEFMGSYDHANEILTIVKYSFSDADRYVNSLWRIQEEPYGGDVINSYNDGPMENGEVMGPFYELESSSPALPLDPEESLEHVHKTYHFEGPVSQLNRIAQRILGCDLRDTRM